MKYACVAMPILMVPILIATTAALPVPPKAERGRTNADCRPQESGPAVRVHVEGLKDRKGRLVLELYPGNDNDLLAPDKDLIAAGKAFRRVPVPVAPSGAVTMCIRAPAPGRYAIFLLHDRDDNGKFGFLKDGVGFANNPRLGNRKPAASAVSTDVQDGIQRLNVRMNYRRGLGMAPLAPGQLANSR